MNIQFLSYYYIKSSFSFFIKILSKYITISKSKSKSQLIILSIYDFKLFSEKNLFPIFEKLTFLKFT